MAQDAAVYRRHFSHTEELQFLNPKEMARDVLQNNIAVVHLFVDILPTGMLPGGQVPANLILQALILARAKLIWVANANPPDAYLKGWAVKSPPTNLLMTLHRNDPWFSKHLDELLALTKAGKTLPMAYVTLNPQIPNGPPVTDRPATVLFAGAPQFALR